MRLIAMIVLVDVGVVDVVSFVELVARYSYVV